MASSDARLSQDEVFDLLSNRRRRYVLNYLLREDRPVSIQELSRELAMWEFDVDADELTDQQEKRIYVALYQTHIPKLEDVGVIDYDADASLVELTEEARQLQPYVEEGEYRERPWPWYYLAIAVAGLVLYAGTVLGVPVVTELSTFQIGVGVLTAFTALALYHYLEIAR